MNKEFYAYIRVSTVKQGEGVSLEAQRDAINAYAKKHSYPISTWLEEKETAAKQGRPIFVQMIKDLKVGKAQGVIMHKIDRSARNLRDWATVGELQDQGIEVHFAAESVDFASRGGRLTADIQAVIAADYIRNLREETLKGIEGRLKQGLYPFKAPIGYLDNGKGQLKTICPTRGSKVKYLFECYATGEHSLLSLVAEAKRINLKNYRERPVTKTCIENMLRNPFYIGLMHIKKRNKTYTGKHKALISLNLYKQVEAVRQGKSFKKITKHNHIYKRSFSCGTCNRFYTAEKQKGHTYYRCHTKNCIRGTIREEVIDLAVAKELRKLQISDVNASKLKSYMQQWTNHNLKTETTTAPQLQVGKLKQKQAQLLDALLDGLIDKQTFEKRNNEFLVLEKELSKTTQKSLNKQQMHKNSGQLFELFKNLYVTYSLANPSEKRQLIKILFSNRIINNKNVELEPSKWMRKATILMTVLLGGHCNDTIRKGIGFPISATQDLESILSFQEWKELRKLYDEITYQNSSSKLPEITNANHYKKSCIKTKLYK